MLDQEITNGIRPAQGKIHIVCFGTDGVGISCYLYSEGRDRFHKFNRTIEFGRGRLLQIRFIEFKENEQTGPPITDRTKLDIWFTLKYSSIGIDLKIGAAK